jgi:hypothetical protein
MPTESERDLSNSISKALLEDRLKGKRIREKNGQIIN